MRTLFQHIDRVRERPHHVRRRIAFGTAGVAAGAVALVWLGTSLATGAFQIQGSDFAQATGAEPADTTSGNGSDTSGVAAAAAASLDTNAPAHLEVVPAAPKASVRSATAPGPAVLPF